jgi:hypothetical protein
MISNSLKINIKFIILIHLIIGQNLLIKTNSLPAMDWQNICLKINYASCFTLQNNNSIRRIRKSITPSLTLNNILNEEDYLNFISRLKKVFSPDDIVKIVNGVTQLCQQLNFQKLPLELILLPITEAIIAFGTQRVNDFLDRMGKVLNEIRTFAISEEYVPQKFWTTISPEGISSLYRILAKELGIKYYQILIKRDSTKRIQSLGNKSLWGFYVRFKKIFNSDPQKIKEKFTHLRDEDIAYAKKNLAYPLNFILRIALHLNPSNELEWAERIAYLHSQGTRFDWHESSDEINLAILLRATREDYFVNPEVVEKYKLDYYNLSKFIPYYRLDTKMIEKVKVSFLDNILLTGMVNKKYRGMNNLRKIFKQYLYPSSEKIHQWIDRIRMMRTQWSKIPSELLNEVLWNFSLRLAQEKRINVENLTLDQWNRVKFLRKPGSDFADLRSALEIFGNWEQFYQIIIINNLPKLEEEIQNLKTEIQSKNGQRVNWNNYSIWAIIELAKREILDKLKITDRSLNNKEIIDLNATDIEGTFAKYIFKSNLFYKKLSLFKATIFVDRYLEERITNPLNTVDYFLRIFYDYSETIWNELAPRVRKEINEMCKVYQKENGLLNNNYTQIKIYDLIKADPLNLFSDDDKLMIDIALQNPQLEFLKQLTFYPFYKSQSP